MPRYKLNVRMEHNGDKGNFLFWDATCIKLFGKTAAECRDELIAVCSARYNHRLNNNSVVCD